MLQRIVYRKSHTLQANHQGLVHVRSYMYMYMYVSYMYMYMHVLMLHALMTAPRAHRTRMCLGYRRGCGITHVAMAA